MLGVLHRRAIGKGPPHFKKHFDMDGYQRLKDPRTALKGPLVIRSVLGLVAVYNKLPVRSAKDGNDNWKNLLSPRVPLSTHPLMEFRGLSQCCVVVILVATVRCPCRKKLGPTNPLF